MNFIAIDVEVSIVGGANGIPFLFFDPNHPFAHRFSFHPLPFESYNNFQNEIPGNREIYWVIEEELDIPIPSLDLQKAFNCFKAIPSTGAKYTIKLCADVPNNSNPTNMPPQTGSTTGHTFVVVSKSNGTKNVTQVFGFYAQKHPGYLDPFRAMPSIVKNNQLREINASIEMNLTEAQFETLRKKALELAKSKYDANDFNCTNYGLDLFNSVRTKPLIIEKYIAYLPANVTLWGTTEINRITIDKTPQMLFKKLHEMKDNKDSEASRIVIDTTTKTKAPLSHGECN